MRQQRFVRTLILLGLFPACLSRGTAHAFDPYLSPRLGIPLTTLQTTLEKVGGSIIFAPRPGSQQGTQEARLPDNAGIVQAGGDSANLTAVVLWLPVDATGKLAGAKARPYLAAFVRLFTPKSEAIMLWIPQVLERAVVDSGSGPHLESQLLDRHQFKAMYVPTLSPPMLSLTVVAAEEQTPGPE
ncbi:MAG TPA: hypothetical protein VGX03_33005 [Candidatus Binatia bacterium]|jgi:hypothetical protein|nr:hypothetical protein [Candidatus Binatia bacterium]